MSSSSSRSIEQTVESYHAVCSRLNKEPNQYIYNMLYREQKDSLIAKEATEMSLYLAGNNQKQTQTKLTNEELVPLFETMKNNCFITGLDLRYNRIDDQGAQEIGEVLKVNVCLRVLNLMCNDIEEEGARCIAKALEQNETLQSLRMNGNKIGNKGGMAFAQMLQINVALERLDLGDTDLKTESVIALATVLRHNSTMKSLNVNRPLLFSHQEETTVHFANMLKVNRTLEELHLRKYDMRDFGVTRLAENLHDNFHLTHLDLSCNRMTRDGAKELAKLLRNDTMLRVLNLGYNRLGDAGAKHIARAISAFNTNLTHLSLVHNEIKGEGLCALADCLKLNATLTNIYIWGNFLEESACIAFSNLLKSGRLESENVDVEPYSVDGHVTLGELSQGLERYYYWSPSYGPHAAPELRD